MAASTNQSALRIFAQDYAERVFTVGISSIAASAATRAIKRGRSYVEGDVVGAERVGELKYPDADARFDPEETVTESLAATYSKHYPELLATPYGEPVPDSMAGQRKHPELWERFEEHSPLTAPDMQKIQRMLADIDQVRLHDHHLHPRLRELLAGTPHEADAEAHTVTPDMLRTLLQRRNTLEMLQSGDPTPAFLHGKWKEPEAHQEYQKGDIIAEPMVGQRRPGVVGKISAAFDNTVGAAAKAIFPESMTEHFSGDRWLYNATAFALIRATNVPNDMLKYWKAGDKNTLPDTNSIKQLGKVAAAPWQSGDSGNNKVQELGKLGGDLADYAGRNWLGCYPAMIPQMLFSDATAPLVEKIVPGAKGYAESHHKEEMILPHMVHIMMRFPAFNAFERVGWRNGVYDLFIKQETGSVRHNPKDIYNYRFNATGKAEHYTPETFAERLAVQKDVNAQLLAEIAATVPFGSVGIALCRSGHHRQGHYDQAHKELAALREAGLDDLAQDYATRHKKTLQVNGPLDALALGAGEVMDKLGKAVNKASFGLISEDAASDWAYYLGQYHAMSGYSSLKWRFGPEAAQAIANQKAYDAYTSSAGFRELSDEDRQQYFDAHLRPEVPKSLGLFTLGQEWILNALVPESMFRKARLAHEHARQLANQNTSPSL